MLQVQATPLSRNGLESKNKENILETTNRKKNLYKTPGGFKNVQSSVIKTSKTSALKTHGLDKKAINPVERLKLGEVKNGTPQRLTATRTTFTKQVKPTTTKKNLRVWKDSPDSDAKSTERSPSSQIKPGEKQDVHQLLAVNKLNASTLEQDDDNEIEYGPPNTVDKLCWTPEDADLVDIASWDIKIEPILKPLVPSSMMKIVEDIKSDSPLPLEFELPTLDENDFMPSFPTMQELDFKFDPLDFEKLALSQKPRKPRSKVLGSIPIRK